MGHRANLLLVDESGYELYYCQWCALSLVKEFFWGPEYAFRFIKQLPPAKGWLDTVWAEGGAMLDTHRNRMMLFGCDDITYDIPLRRVYHELIQLIWEGWQIDWAHNGIIDLAEYVGYPRERVHTQRSEGRDAIKLSLPGEPEWTTTIASIRLGDGTIRIIPLEGMHDPLIGGERLVSVLKAEAKLDHFSMASTGADFPFEGFHIDEGKQDLYIWSAQPDGLIEDIRPYWEGWEIHWLKDAYETLIALTDNRITLQDRTTEELLSSLRAILLSEERSMVDRYVELTKQLDFEPNPVALHEPQQTNIQIRRMLFEEVVARWKGRTR